VVWYVPWCMVYIPEGSTTTDSLKSDFHAFFTYGTTRTPCSVGRSGACRNQPVIERHVRFLDFNRSSLEKKKKQSTHVLKCVWTNAACSCAWGAIVLWGVCEHGCDQLSICQSVTFQLFEWTFAANTEFVVSSRSPFSWVQHDQKYFPPKWDGFLSDFPWAWACPTEGGVFRVQKSEKNHNPVWAGRAQKSVRLTRRCPRSLPYSGWIQQHKGVQGVYLTVGESNSIINLPILLPLPLQFDLFCPEQIKPVIFTLTIKSAKIFTSPTVNIVLFLVSTKPVEMKVICTASSHDYQHLHFIFGIFVDILSVLRFLSRYGGEPTWNCVYAVRAFSVLLSKSWCKGLLHSCNCRKLFWRKS